MTCIVVGARKFGINPDNIATPIAASLGDLITLSILALISSFFYRHRGREGAKDGVYADHTSLGGSWNVIPKERSQGAVGPEPSLHKGGVGWGRGGTWSLSASPGWLEKLSVE